MYNSNINPYIDFPNVTVSLKKTLSSMNYIDNLKMAIQEILKTSDQKKALYKSAKILEAAEKTKFFDVLGNIEKKLGQIY